MPMRCYFWTRQVAVKFWPVYKSRSIFWTDFEDLKGRLIHRKIRYEPTGSIYLLCSVDGMPVQCMQFLWCKFMHLR